MFPDIADLNRNQMRMTVQIVLIWSGVGIIDIVGIGNSNLQCFPLLQHE